MVKTVGPASGSRGQVGFKEEGKWGYPASPPDTFFEFLNESLVSTYTNLVSNAIRADRAVHKQRLGTESAGGDINAELAPEGFGTLIKHALGQRLTKRLDVAFVLVYSGADTDRTITMTSSTISSAGTTAGDDFSVTITNGMTLQALITALNAETNFKCYAPWGSGTTGYFAVDDKTASTSTLGAGDFNSAAVAKTSAGVFNLEAIAATPIPPSGATHLVFFPVNMTYGVYEHELNGHDKLPEGLTLEIGRDIAAFNYYGSKVGSMAMSIQPGEMVTSTFSFLSKGSSTVGDPVANAANTGWAPKLTTVRYAGTAESAKIGIDTTEEMFRFAAGTSGAEVDIYYFSLERGYYSHDGYYFEVTTLAGLMDLLEYETGYFSTTRYPGFAMATASTSLATLAFAALETDTDTTISLGTDATICPLVRGDYIGTDQGESKTITVTISTGGATDGTAAFTGAKSGVSGTSDPQSINYNRWYNVYDGDGYDTGFDVMFPISTTLTVSDVWTFTTFKDEYQNVTYTATETFSGFQGAVLVDHDDGRGLVPQAIMGLDFTLNNNLYADKFELGDRQRAAVIPQRRSVEGTMNLEFDDLDIYRMMVNGVEGDLRITFTSEDYIGGSSTPYSFQIRFPKTKYSGGTPNVADESLIRADFPFIGLWDDDNDLPDIRITLTNGQSYI